jgi:maltodextrin utilization protein YvdJ
MKLLFVILFLIALFHLSVYYCNIDLFTKEPVMDKELTETREDLEKYLNELKQYDSHNKHG